MAGKDQEGNRPANLERHVATGSAWTVSVRWASRLTGLVSTIVLARLLTPADYGVVAIAMVIVATIEVFNQTGQQLAIIRLPHPTREHYDSAWTIFIILSTILGLAIWLAAPLAQVYFHEPRAAAVVKVLAFRTFLGGFENIGVVDFQRNLQFSKVFQYRTYPSLISFVVGLIAAFVLRNYWALVIGIMTQQLCGIALSYALSPFRPRLSLHKVSELWSFSIWTFLKSIGAYVANQIDKLAIGGFGGAVAMGRYEVASDLATAPSAEINQPMISVLFPVMAKVQHDRARLKTLYLSVVYWSILICSSSAIGIALITSDMVDLVLGPKWIDAKPLLPWLALAYGIAGPSFTVFSTFDVIGKPHISARLQWAWTACLAVFVVGAAIAFRSVLAIAVARLIVGCVTAPVLFFFVIRELRIRVADILFLLVRPLVASFAMVMVVRGLQDLLHPGAMRLCITTMAGASIYIAVVMALWHFSSESEGPEAVVSRNAKRYWNKIRDFDWATGSLLIRASKAPSSAGVTDSAPDVTPPGR